MTSMPPDNQDPEDIDARYRQLSAADSARPHGAVSAAVIAHAARLAAERAAGVSSERRPGAFHGWRAPLFGGLAAAALAGFLVIPRFTRLDHPPVKALIQPTAEFTAPVAAAGAPTSSAETASKRAAPRASAPVKSQPQAQAPAQATELDEVIVTGAERHQHQAPVAGKTIGKAQADAAPQALVAERGEALRRSAGSGDLPGLRAVLDEQVSIDSRDSSGRTALLLAVLSGRDVVVSALLARGADPNISDAYGETPLHAAIAANRTEIVQELRRAGAH